MHVPAHAPLESVAQGGRPPRGAPSTGEQVPSRPATSQAAHCPPQVVSQQTPSTQLPEAHSSPASHGVPFADFRQAPPSQRALGAQSSSTWHDVVQAASPASQRNGLQLTIVGVQEPSLAQTVASASWTSSSQAALLHAVP